MSVFGNRCNVKFLARDNYRNRIIATCLRTDSVTILRTVVKRLAAFAFGNPAFQRDTTIPQHSADPHGRYLVSHRLSVFRGMVPQSFAADAEQVGPLPERNSAKSALPFTLGESIRIGQLERDVALGSCASVHGLAGLGWPARRSARQPVVPLVPASAKPAEPHGRRTTRTHSTSRP